MMIVADSGYSSGKKGSRCEQSGITAIVPLSKIVNKRGKGTLAAMSSPTMQKQTAGVARPKGLKTSSFARCGLLENHFSFTV